MRQMPDIELALAVIALRAKSKHLQKVSCLTLTCIRGRQAILRDLFQQVSINPISGLPGGPFFDFHNFLAIGMQLAVRDLL